MWTPAMENLISLNQTPNCSYDGLGGSTDAAITYTSHWSQQVWALSLEEKETGFQKCLSCHGVTVVNENW